MALRDKVDRTIRSATPSMVRRGRSICFGGGRVFGLPGLRQHHKPRIANLASLSPTALVKAEWFGFSHWKWQPEAPEADGSVIIRT